MSTKEERLTTLTCDRCGRHHVWPHGDTTKVHGDGIPAEKRWGTVIHDGHHRDVCPSCAASFRAWAIGPNRYGARP